jgi:hypothetical protein
MSIGEFAMPDYLGALVVPAVLVVSGLFAVCDSWRRRRKRARKARSARRASEERERGVLREAESVVYAAHARLARLYLGPDDGAQADVLHRP